VSTSTGSADVSESAQVTDAQLGGE
jgi:hypothetical protein